MQSVLGSQHQKSGTSAPCALWPVDLKLTHLDWNPEATLIHFQGQYLTICDLDYIILQGEIQNIPKIKAAVDIGEFCLVEDVVSGRWYRGRVQNRKKDLFDVFLIDHGNVLSVNIAHISSCSNDLFILPPKIVCGFLANVLLLHGCSNSVVERYFSNLIRRNVTGYIQALLPHKVLLLEAPDINIDLVKHGFGRHVDTDTFLLLVGMLTEVPLKQNMEPVPDLLLEKPWGQEFSFKPSDLQGYKDILALCGPRLSCGTHAKVCVTAAVNPGLFYCQKTSMETDLWEMSKKLAAVNECRTKECNQKTAENLSLLCSVKGRDGKWYRGYVQFLPVNSQLRVLFIDYGFYESVKVENVHRLPPDLFSTTVMAFPCSLSSLSDQDELVKTKQLNFLKAGLLGRVLDVEIRGFDEEQHLYSITVLGAEDNSVKELTPIQELPSMKVESVFEEELSTKCGHLSYETIMGNAVRKTLEAEGVHVNSVFVGYVEHVQNPSYFWIRTQKRNDEFEEMMTKMADNFSQVKLDEDVLLKPELGTLCCAVYEEDMHFYRGVVTDSLEHGSEVLFIDFGNIEKVPHMLIKKIPETFANKPAFAFCCTLVNVFPLDEVWTSATTDFFRRAVSNKALLVHVVKMGKNKFVVDLHDMESDNNQSITELLITSNQAEYWKNISIGPVVQNNTDLTEKTRCPRYGVTSDINGNTEQLNDCEKEEKTCKIRTEKAQAPAGFKALSIKPGCNFAVVCSCIKSPSDIWCQRLDKLPALEELMDKVHQYYSTHTVPLQSGDPCCVAKSPQDGRWYRAFITEKQKSYAKVMMVDYGFTIQIDEHNLQAIMPEYVYLDRQAFRCSLNNLMEPADPKYSGDWGLEVCKSLKYLVLNSTSCLRCEVVSQLNVKNKGLCNVVELYNTETQQSLTNLLLEQGLPRVAPISAKQLSTVIPQSFVYSSHELKPGNEEQVYITHISSQWEIYCHLERNTEIIEELEKKISEESEKMMQGSTRAVVRKLSLAKYFDGQWYRCLAYPVQSPLHLGVFFVDYGNTNIPEKTNVMFVPRDSTDLLYTPMQAVKCHLASVSTEELYADVKEWLDGAILNKQVRAVIVGKSADGSFDVELFDGDVNINEKVKELVLSLSPKPKTIVSFDMSSTKTKPKTLRTGHTKPSVECQRQCKLQSSKSRTLNAPRCTQVASAPSKKKKNSKKDVHDEQPQHREETEITQLLFLPDMKVSAGFRAKCFVSHINSVNSFFLQLSEDEPAILKLGENLNSSIFRDSLKTASSLRVNDLVLAEYEEDGALYRCVVKDCEGSSRFKVEFVDYGNSAVMGMEKIYSIPKECLSHPRFSISCSLLDTSMFKSDVSFTDAVMEKPLMVDFVRHDVHWEVKVEILDGDACVPAALEAAVESSTEREKGEKSPVDSFEIEEKVRSCEQNFLPKEVSKKKTAESEGTTVDDENFMLKATPATLSPKPEEHRRAPSINKGDSKENPRIITKSKVESDCADAIVPPSIQAKDTETSTVLSVLSNSNFYTRLNRTSELLTALERLIADNLYKCKMVAEEDVKQGLKCLVQVDKQWHRAVVQDVGLKTCQVLLVDHGITETIPSGLIRGQCSELTKIPPLAVLCKVNCLGSSEGEGTPELWCETLKPLIGKEVKLVFVCYSVGEKLWKVEIVMNGLFLLRQITTLLQQNEEMVPSTAETQDEKAEGEFNLDTSPPQQLVFAPIEIDQMYSGLAAAVTTPFKFCIVLDDLLLLMNKMSLILDDLPEQLSPLPEAHLVPGTCCLFKSDTKNKWCRAEIADADTTAVLNLVDYGHYECIPYKDCSKLKRFPEEITNLPKVTYPCILRGVKPVGVDGQWTDGAAVFFQECLYQKNLQIFFREFVSNTHLKVDVLADGVHVAKELVDAGHADYMDIMLGLRFQEQSPCRAAPQCPDSEEECGQEDEGFNGKTDLFVDSTDEAEGEIPLSVVSESSQCFLM
ncbi:tudor domain-containing protein 15 [Anoplopoma fimbria]|uniref:tudor domain-containing protein 15 n=1 Tax=Anoplopoma fimbria TaxID=229290 RepID=UPI0023EDC45D|nr:tudor domain-containing protein 15 [Anoplopoma fimbria]XP_054474930.1 tudor domain-containing protein 15 [Anoplopoma fimbria]